MTDTTAATEAPKETLADGARAIFDALTEKARAAESERARLDTIRQETEAKESEAKKARVRDAKGRFQIEVPMPKAEKKAAVERKAPAPKEEHPEPKTDRQGRTEEPEADADATADHEKALTALRRAKVPKAVLDATDAKEKLRWGLELAEIQANTDRLTKEHRELKKQAEERAKDPPKETLPAAKQVAATQADLDEAIKAFDEAGPEYGKALRDALAIKDRILEERHEGQTKLIKELQSSIELIRLEGMVTTARTELLDVYPGLRDSDRYQSVLSRMERISKDPEVYAHIKSPNDRMLECMRDSCEAEFAGDIEIGLRSKAKETDRKRFAGQMTAPSRAAQTNDVKGQDRAEKIYWLMATEGLNGAEARARVDGLK